MKFRILTLILAFGASLSTFSQGINFEHGTFQEALDKAKAENKMVFMDCYSSWCGPCKLMAKTVFTQKEVGDFFNANFVNMKVDYEKGEGPELNKKYPARSFPVFYYISPDGKVLHKAVGSSDAGPFMEGAKIAIDPQLRLTSLREKYEKGKRDYDFLLTYFWALDKIDEKETMKIVSRQVIAKSSIEKFMNKESFSVITGAQFPFKSKEYKYLLKNKDLVKTVAYEFDIYDVLQKPIRKHLTDYAKTCKSIEELNAEVNKVVSLNSDMNREDLMLDHKPIFYLANNQFEDWIDVKLKFAEKNRRRGYAFKILEIGDEIYANSKLSGSSVVIDKYSSVAQELVKKEENLVIGNLMMAKLYLHKREKEKAMKCFNIYIDNNYKSGKPQPQIEALKKAIESL